MQKFLHVQLEVVMMSVEDVVHDIFHTHQKDFHRSGLMSHGRCRAKHDHFHTPLHFYMNLPHSSDHFHAPLHFCTTWSTMMSVQLYIFARHRATHQTTVKVHGSGLMRTGRRRAKMFQGAWKWSDEC